MCQHHWWFGNEASAGLSGEPMNFVWGGGSTNSVEDRESEDLGTVAI